MRVAFLGDEASGAGFRLAGVEARVVAPGDEAAALAQALAVAPLVLVSASIAARTPAAMLRAACAAIAPLVVVVPDLAGEAPVPDIATRLRRQLGLLDTE